MDGVDLIQVVGKSFFGKLHRLGVVFLLEFGVLCHLGKTAGQILDLLRQLADGSGVVHVPLLQLLGVVRLQLHNLLGKICSFVHQSLHVRGVLEDILRGA